MRVSLLCQVYITLKKYSPRRIKFTEAPPTRPRQTSKVGSDTTRQEEKATHKFVVALLGPKLLFVYGLVKFVPAVAYHSCFTLPVTFSQPGTSVNFGPLNE